MILASACLLGIGTAYSGRNHPTEKLIHLAAQGKILPVCPEVAGGLSIPRPPAEIYGGSAGDVLDGRAVVINNQGQDVTPAFLAGAYMVLHKAQRWGISIAILKSRSPSCGSQQIYDGTFSGKLIDGVGITTALLRQNGIMIYNERDEYFERLVGL